MIGKTHKYKLNLVNCISEIGIRKEMNVRTQKGRKNRKKQKKKEVKSVIK